MSTKPVYEVMLIKQVTWTERKTMIFRRVYIGDQEKLGARWFCHRIELLLFILINPTVLE